MSKRIVERLETEIRPLLEVEPHDGGYDCCGCSSYRQILDHAIRIVREETNGDTPNTDM